MTYEGAVGALADSRLRLLFEAASSPMVVVDPGRRMALVSHGAEQLFGYRREELLGRDIELLIPERFRASQLGQVTASASAPRARTIGVVQELYGRRKDGVEVAIEMVLDSLETPDGVFTLASIVDVTARRHVEDELRRSNDDLGQFAYIASHDLQEPLRMVASYTELLAQRYQGKLDERADKYIHYAVDGAKRMQRLLADLLSYSRVGSQGKSLVPVSAEAVAEGVVAAFAPTLRKANATVSVGALPIVLADERQLRQLFQNLIGNALKFQGEAPAVVEVSATPLDGAWQFAVKDNGIGVERQHMDRIFQMFQRLHERGKYEGSGVGLAIAKRVVERHGGRIWLESQPGVGSTFFFTLRAAARAPEQP